jgi:hypothetical protein
MVATKSSEKDGEKREREKNERPKGGFPSAAAFLEDELLCRTFFSHWKAVSS